MRLLTLCLGALLFAAPAFAGWSVAQDGAALVENGGAASLALRCDNNVNTGSKPSWRLELSQTGLGSSNPPRLELGFLTTGHKPIYLEADYRLGKLIIDGMENNSNAALSSLVSRLKRANTLTVTLKDASAEDIVFSLKGSSKSITTVAKACQ
jgi:hypothetical protein